jgi:hypothetical protein
VASFVEEAVDGFVMALYNDVIRGLSRDGAATEELDPDEDDEVGDSSDDASSCTLKSDDDVRSGEESDDGSGDEDDDGSGDEDDEEEEEEEEDGEESEGAPEDAGDDLRDAQHLQKRAKRG